MLLHLSSRTECRERLREPRSDPGSREEGLDSSTAVPDSVGSASGMTAEQ
jgi:hypothetical protein